MNFNLVPQDTNSPLPDTTVQNNQQQFSFPSYPFPFPFPPSFPPSFPSNTIFDFSYSIPQQIINNKFTIPGKRGTYYYLTPQQLHKLGEYRLFSHNNSSNPWVTSILTQNGDSWLVYSGIYNVFPDFSFNLDELLKGTYFEITPPIYGGHVQPRDIAFVSDESKGYRYSKNIIPSQPLNEYQKALLNLVNTRFVQNSDTERPSLYNGILINYYENQDNSIGAHSDDETTLGPNGVISIVFGETRMFRIRNLTFPNQVYIDGILQNFTTNKQKTPPIIHDLDVQSGTVIWMGGAFQTNFQHEIPKSSSILGPRISFTFRAHKE